jgi:hypothetical protein
VNMGGGATDWGNGVVWADFKNEGTLDALIVNTGQANTLYYNPFDAVASPTLVVKPKTASGSSSVSTPPILNPFNPASALL